MKFFKLFAKLINLIFILPFDISVRIEGVRLFANKPDRILALILWKFKLLEGFEINLLKKIIYEGMTVIDIGANLGLYTSILSKLVGKKGKVFAFEPDPNNFRLLKKCIIKNNLGNVVLEQKAISSNTHKGYLYQSIYNSGDNRIYESKDYFKKTLVEIITLDEYFKKIPEVNFIKMDVQGSEYLAFLGMKELISKNNNLIIFSEFCPELLINCGSAPQDYIKDLILNNLNIYLIISNRKILKNISENDLDFIYKIKSYVNLFIAKNKFDNL